MQLRFGCELLEIDRRVVPRQRIEQAHHAVDHLDRRLNFFFCHSS